MTLAMSWTPSMEKHLPVSCPHFSSSHYDAPVAQLDRASVYGTEGWGFKSLRAHQSSLKEESYIEPDATWMRSAISLPILSLLRQHIADADDKEVIGRLATRGRITVVPEIVLEIHGKLFVDRHPEALVGAQPPGVR